MCTPQMVSARSLGHYAWICISGILSPGDTWGYQRILAILGCVWHRCHNIGSATKHNHEKGTLRMHTAAQNASVMQGSQKDPYNRTNTVTYYSFPGFWRFLLSCLKIFLGRSIFTKTSRNAQCHNWPHLMRLVGWCKSTAGHAKVSRVVAKPPILSSLY